MDKLFYLNKTAAELKVRDHKFFELETAQEKAGLKTGVRADFFRKKNEIDPLFQDIRSADAESWPKITKHVDKVFADIQKLYEAEKAQLKGNYEDKTIQTDNI